MVLEFNPGNHQYRVIIKGRKYKVPSVTRIVSVIDKSGPLVWWAADNTLALCKQAIQPGTEYAEVYLEAIWNAARKESQRIKSDAAARGAAIHGAIERSLKNGGDSSVPCAEAVPIGEWLQCNSCVVTDVERKVYSRHHRYSGTLDAIGTIEGQVYLLDWKTSKSVYPEFRLQTAAYVAAYEEEHPGVVIQGRYIIQITEDGGVVPHFYPRETYPKDFSAFLAAKQLFTHLQLIDKEGRKK